MCQQEKMHSAMSTHDEMSTALSRCPNTTEKAVEMQIAM